MILFPMPRITIAFKSERPTLWTRALHKTPYVYKVRATRRVSPQSPKGITQQNLFDNKKKLTLTKKSFKMGLAAII
jgi:hypothetical protein